MRNNSLLRKALVMICTIALVACVSVAATIAYFTDSEAVTNTFTVGKVGISMDEALVNDEGQEIEGDGAKRVQANEYHLIPGKTYDKDPTIHVNADSENCWLFVKVENGIKPIETTDQTKTIHGQMNKENAEGGKWIAIDEAKGIYAYDQTVAAGANVVVFTTFTIDGETVDNDKIALYATKDYNTAINVTAYAIQAAGFDTYADAWTSLNAQDKIVITNP